MARAWVHTLEVNPSPAAPRRRPAGSPFRNPPPPVVEVYEVDDRVTHDAAGLGRVVAVEDGNIAVVVQFGLQRIRIQTPFTKLTKL
jgi:hypothetical protein